MSADVLQFPDVAASLAVGTASDETAVPDRAARAIQLSQMTGVNPNAIWGDVEGFERQTKGQMAGDLVRNNPHLAEYMLDDPMNARLSIDDLGNLDVATQAAGKLNNDGVMATFAKNFLTGRTGMAGIVSDLASNVDRIGTAAVAAYDFAGQQHEFQKLLAEPWVKPFLAGIGPIGATAAAGAVGGFDSFMRLFNAAMVGASEAAGVLYEANTGDAAMGRRLVRDTYAMLQIGTAGPGIFGGHVGPKAFQLQGVAEPIRAAAPYLKEGKEPPLGLHPEIDKLKAEQAKFDLQNLDDALSEAQKSSTREADPDRYAALMRMVNKGKIGINVDAIDRIYGDKPALPDDGKLGWVQGINEQIALVRETGGDVEVPIADWLAHVDPQVAKELHDDLRVRPQQPTVNDLAVAKEADVEIGAPRPTSPVESVRAASALEPMFGLGDRKLNIKKTKEWPDEGFGPGHTFEMMNEKGSPVGYVLVGEQNGGKTLYIDNISGTQGLGPRDFGPSLIRDLLRQLKEQFPNAEEIAGFRVSGAREKAGKVGETSVKLGLDSPEMVQQFKQILEGQWDRIEGPSGRGVESLNVPYEKMSPEQRAIADGIVEVLERIAPRDTEIWTPAKIRGEPGEKGTIHGFFQEFDNSAPLIAVALHSPDYAFHEAIHALRRGEFLTKKEWATLVEASEVNKWEQKYEIGQRYKGADKKLRIEEAIAEGYRNWENGKAVPKELHPIFERIKEVFEAIKAKLKEIFGHEPTFEEVFQRISSGEVAKREGKFSNEGQAFGKGPEQLDLGQELTRMEDRAAFDKAAAIGMTVDQYKRYMKLIEERQKADYEKELAKAEKEQKRRQSAEWKAEANAMYPEVAKEILNRPDVSADRFMRDGILYGERVDKVRIGEEYLSPEQREGLPKAYVAKKGMHPDDIAGLFGYDSGAAMVARLSQFDREWRDSGVRREDFFRKMTEAEVERRMELKHGSLEENILAEAKDQALSETQLQLLHEETQALATQAGAQFAIPKDVLANQIKENFAKYPVETVSSDRLLADAGRAGRAAEMALLKKDFAEAFRQKQRQYVAVTLAKEAGRLEKEQAQFAKLEKRYAKERPNDPEERREFNNYIQDLLQQAGYKVKLSPEQIQGNFDHYGNVPLTDFAATHNSYGGEVYVAPFIAEGRLRQVADKMTVEEWRDFRDTIQSLDHNGREIGAIEIAGAKQEFADWRKGVIENIKELPKRDATQQRQGGRWLYGVDASITRMEEIVKDLDLRKELGPLFEGLIAPMMRSKAKEFDMVTELSKYFKEQKGANKEWRKTLGDAVPQDFLIDPATRAPYDLTRENMIQIMLNWGTESNRLKFNQGYASLELGRKATKEEAAQFGLKVQHLLDTHATAEDWKFVQQMWQPFKGWKGEADKVSRNVSGIAPKWIPEAEVVTPHGTFEGGYWPVKYDKIGSDMEVVRGKQVGDGPLGSQYFRAATSKNYLKERTGYVDFVDITTSLEQAAGVMQQTIHDIAFRDAVVQASKIIYDKQIRAAIRNHYGIEYERQLEPWLKRVANPNTVDDHGIAAINSFLRRVRINLVGHALPLNLKVILSPDIGRPDPRVWTAFESDRAANVKIAMEQSNEIRHMVYNMDRDYRESMEGMVKRGILDSAQRKAVEWGFAPMMKVSQEFRMATFVHEWNKAKAKGHTDSQAAQIADSIVREQHGAASIVDLPSAMASSEGMKMLTMFYGYFNTMYNWQRQLPGQVRRGEAKQAVWTAAGSVGVGAFFGAALFNKGKEDDSWWKIIGKALLLQPLQTVPILRDAANLYIEGNRPGTPVASIMNTMSSLYTDLKRKAEGKPMQRPIQNTANVVGPLTGFPLAQVGRTGEFLYDVASGQSRPKNILEWMRGIIHGEIKAKK